MRIAIFVSGILCSLLCACDSPDGAPQAELIPQMEKLPTDRYNVAFLVMDGVYNTELTAPWDIFHHTIFRDSVKAMNVFSVAEKSRMIRTFEGIRFYPDYSWKDSLPRIDILVVPSAEHHLDSDLQNGEMLEFVRKTARDCEFVMSHCDGAFVLAAAGLLNDRSCTTFPADIEEMQSRFPKTKVLDGPLFVHDGKYITSVGGARSFEASLYLCEYLYGKKAADEIAEGMVIDWNQENLNYVVVRSDSTQSVQD